MSDAMKSRLAYPQHLTREALMEALVNTPYDEPFSEAAVCEQVLYGAPVYAVSFDFTAFLRVWDEQVNNLWGLNDVFTAVGDFAAATNWQGMTSLAALHDPSPTNFAEALAAKNKRNAAKASERSRDVVKRGRRNSARPSSET